MPANISKSNAMRLYYAAHSTMEAMAYCGVPYRTRDGEVQKVMNEILDLIEKGYDCPESPTERKWINREQTGYTYKHGDTL